MIVNLTTPLALTKNQRQPPQQQIHNICGSISLGKRTSTLSAAVCPCKCSVCVWSNVRESKETREEGKSLQIYKSSLGVSHERLQGMPRVQMK